MNGVAAVCTGRSTDAIKRERKMLDGGIMDGWWYEVCGSARLNNMVFISRRKSKIGKLPSCARN